MKGQTDHSALYAAISYSQEHGVSDPLMMDMRGLRAVGDRNDHGVETGTKLWEHETKAGVKPIARSRHEGAILVLKMRVLRENHLPHFIANLEADQNARERDVGFTFNAQLDCVATGDLIGGDVLRIVEHNVRNLCPALTKPRRGRIEGEYLDNISGFGVGKGALLDRSER